MSGKIFLVSGAIFGFLGVAIGAFAAHGLKSRLSADLFSVFEVGVRYHMYHALALFAVAWLMSVYQNHLFLISGWCFIAGILIFSGSLYVLALTGAKAWGAVTPVGGLAFLAGWLLLFFAALKLPR